MGSSDSDEGTAIATDGSGNIYLTGSSRTTWGSPVRAHSGSGFNDIFVARINDSGNLLWNTFLGSSMSDNGYDITLDDLGYIYVTGFTSGTWGFPDIPFYGVNDAFVAYLNRRGNLLSHIFMGCNYIDYGRGIAVDNSGNTYITGNSRSTWGNPVLPHNGGLNDILVANLNQCYRINASVSGGNGSISPRSQIVGFGGNAKIHISPDLGYGIESIRDNGRSRSISNPYVIRNIREGHNVVVTMTPESYQVCTSVSGGHGSVSPGNQTVLFGENAIINITPDSGYRIQSITDNGESMPIANPYVVYHLMEDHTVVVTFEPDLYPPVIETNAVRKTERAWIIKKEFGEIAIHIIEHPTKPLPVSNYILYRMDNGTWNLISEFDSSGTFTYIDTYLEAGKQVSYQMKAMDSDGIVVAESNITKI